MQDGILFDNVLIADDEKVAESFREKTWKVKYEAEKAKQKEEEKAAGVSDGLSGFHKTIFDLLYKVADIPLLASQKSKIIGLIEKGETQPNLTISILASIAVVILTVLFRILFGGKKTVATPKPVPVARTEAPSSEAEAEPAGSSGEVNGVISSTLLLFSLSYFCYFI